MMKNKDVYVLLFKDTFDGSLGSTQPMSKLEADIMTKEALKVGYCVAAVCLTKLFESHKYVINPMFQEKEEGD